MIPLEERMAKLEGAFEQMNARIGSLEPHMLARFASLEDRLGRPKDRLGRLESESRSNFRWLLGTQLTMWVTIIAAILLR